jgi:hypothetical protein
MQKPPNFKVLRLQQHIARERYYVIFQHFKCCGIRKQRETLIKMGGGGGVGI